MDERTKFDQEWANEQELIRQMRKSTNRDMYQHLLSVAQQTFHPDMYDAYKQDLDRHMSPVEATRPEDV